jgi:hypothetical protein
MYTAEIMYADDTNLTACSDDFNYLILTSHFEFELEQYPSVDSRSQ